jgi:hypothetical protein
LVRAEDDAWDSYGGRQEERIPAQVVISHKRLQRLDVLRQLTKEGWLTL